jgi:hypothetical protein
MEKITQQYADELVEKYYFLKDKNDYYTMSKYKAIQCAIIDVENTIIALEYQEAAEGTTFGKLEYYQQVLQILKDKL